MRSKRSLRNAKILVTAGPTREYFDPVRFLSNPSSGKMGYALVEAALKKGAKVTLITGPVSLPPPKGVKLIRVVSAKEMCESTLKEARTTDVIIMAAAVSDFRPKNFSPKKLKKSGKKLTVTFKPTQDILKELGRRKKKGQILVGFAAETNDVIRNAQKKLKKKNLDLIIANQVGLKESGFESNKNKITLVSPTKTKKLPLLSKKVVAHQIFQFIEEFK